MCFLELVVRGLLDKALPVLKKLTVITDFQILEN